MALIETTTTTTVPKAQAKVAAPTIKKTTPSLKTHDEMKVNEKNVAPKGSVLKSKEITPSVPKTLPNPIPKGAPSMKQFAESKIAPKQTLKAHVEESDDDDDDDEPVDYDNLDGGVALEPMSEDNQKFIDGLGDFIEYAENKGALYGAGLTQVFGYNVANFMKKMIIENYDKPKFRDLMKEFLNQPSVFQFVDGFMLDPYQAMVYGARAVLAEMFPIFKVQLDQPNFSCHVKGHPVDHSDYLPLVPEVTETLEIERAKIICMVTSRSKYTKAALIVNKIESVPITNQYIEVNPAIGEALNSVVGMHYHSNDLEYLKPIINFFPKPNMERMQKVTAHIQKPVLHLFNALAKGTCAFPQENEQITLKQFRSFRAFRSSIGDFAKSFDLPYAALCNPVSTIMKWYFPLLEVSKLGTKLFAIGSSEHQRFGNLLSLFNVNLIDGDLFDVNEELLTGDWKPPGWSGANIRVKEKVAENSFSTSDEVIEYGDMGSDETVADTLGEVTIDVSVLPPDHISKWNHKSSLGSLVPSPEFDGIVLLSDVYLEVSDTLQDAYPGFKSRNLEYLAQEKAYKHYAQLLKTKVVNVVVFKSFPLFTVTKKDGNDYPTNFSYGYLVQYFGGFCMRSFPGARLHNGEHIFAISRNKITGWQPIPQAKDPTKANHFVTHLTAIVRYKMYHANVIRNSLLSCGYASVYKGSDVYPLKREEGICLRLVPYTRPTVGTSLSQYNVTMDSVEENKMDDLIPLQHNHYEEEDEDNASNGDQETSEPTTQTEQTEGATLASKFDTSVATATSTTTSTSTN